MSSCAVADRRAVEFQTQVSPDVERAIIRLFGAQKTLEDVVRWGLAQKPVCLVEDVIVQDEYTHDVVLKHPSGVYLVYDST